MGSTSTLHVLEVCNACGATSVIPLARTRFPAECAHCNAAGVSVPYLSVLAAEIDREQRPILNACTNALRLPKAKRVDRLRELQTEHGFEQIASSMDYYDAWLTQRRDARLMALVPRIAAHVAEGLADELAELDHEPRAWPLTVAFDGVGPQQAELLFAGEGSVVRFGDGTGQIFAAMEWLSASPGPSPNPDGNWSAPIEFAGGARALLTLDAEGAEWLVESVWDASHARRRELVVQQGRAVRHQRRAADPDIAGSMVFGAMVAVDGLATTAHYQSKRESVDAELDWLTAVWWNSPWAAARAFFANARATGTLSWPVPFTPLPQEVLALEPTRLRLVVGALMTGATQPQRTVLTATPDNVVIEAQAPGLFWNCIAAETLLKSPRAAHGDGASLALWDAALQRYLGEPQQLLLSADDCKALFEQWDRARTRDDEVVEPAARHYPSTHAAFAASPPPPPDDPIFKAPLGTKPDLRSIAAPRPAAAKRTLAPARRSKLSEELRRRKK